MRRPGSVIRGLTVFGHPSILLRVPLSVREAAPNFGLIDPVFLPPFSQVTGGRMAALQTEELYDDISGSVLRALSGFLMSVALIVPLGLGVAWHAQVGNLLNQFTEICQNTASLAVLPVFILFLDICELSRSRCDK